MHFRRQTCLQFAPARDRVAMSSDSLDVRVRINKLRIWKHCRFVDIDPRFIPRQTSSAQGNCSAKSLAALVMLSILPCSSILPCLPPVKLSIRGPAVGGWPQGVQVGEGRGGGSGGRGQGTFHPPCHILHCHMVLRPKGTSHNEHQ